MFRRTGLILWIFFAATGPSVAFAQTTVDGSTAGGATYRIAVPAAWNGDLVIWNHGLTMDAPTGAPDLGPLAAIQLGEGYAVAASSYRQVGWATFRVVKDVRALVAAFEARFGSPARIIVTGASLGGLVTAQLLEKGRLGNIVAALTWCAPLAGSRNWDAALDLRLTYDAVCNGVAGGEIPGSAEGLPAASDLSDDDIAAAVETCTGVDVPRGRRSVGQADRLAMILDNLRLSEEFLQTDMWYATRVMADLVHDRGKLKGKVAVGNADVEYPVAAVDETIVRVTPSASAARRLDKNYTPSGRIGTAKLIALHTDKDDLVVVENLADYRDRISPSQVVAAVVVEKRPSHCGFTAAEALASWESLQFWTGGGGTPSIASIQSLCELFAATGVEGPCRIDPNFVIPSLDSRIPPR